jgi:hypothetical protein
MDIVVISVDGMAVIRCRVVIDPTVISGAEMMVISPGGASEIVPVSLAVTGLMVITLKVISVTSTITSSLTSLVVIGISCLVVITRYLVVELGITVVRVLVKDRVRVSVVITKVLKVEGSKSEEQSSTIGFFITIIVKQKVISFDKL